LSQLVPHLGPGGVAKDRSREPPQRVFPPAFAFEKGLHQKTQALIVLSEEFHEVLGSFVELGLRFGHFQITFDLLVDFHEALIWVEGQGDWEVGHLEEGPQHRFVLQKVPSARTDPLGQVHSSWPRNPVDGRLIELEEDFFQVFILAQNLIQSVH